MEVFGVELEQGDEMRLLALFLVGTTPDWVVLENKYERAWLSFYYNTIWQK